MHELKGKVHVGEIPVEDFNYINELIVRDEALSVIPDEKEPNKWGYCPKCRTLVARDNEDNHFCKKCGQRLDIENGAF